MLVIFSYLWNWVFLFDFVSLARAYSSADWDETWHSYGPSCWEIDEAFETVFCVMELVEDIKYTTSLSDFNSKLFPNFRTHSFKPQCHIPLKRPLRFHYPFSVLSWMKTKLEPIRPIVCGLMDTFTSLALKVHCIVYTGSKLTFCYFFLPQSEIWTLVVTSETWFSQLIFLLIITQWSCPVSMTYWPDYADSCDSCFLFTYYHCTIDDTMGTFHCIHGIWEVAWTNSNGHPTSHISICDNFCVFNQLCLWF